MTHYRTVILLPLILLCGCARGPQQRSYIFVADDKNGIDRLGDMAGRDFTTAYLATNGSFEVSTEGIQDIALDRHGRIYFATRQDNCVTRMDDITGRNLVQFLLFRFPAPSCGSGPLENSPTAIAVDGQDRIYYTYATGQDGDGKECAEIIRMDDMKGKNQVSLGAFAWQRSSGHFRLISSLAIDSRGRIYAADIGTNCVLRVDDMTGRNWTTFGVRGEFSRPICIRLDSADRIYILDQGDIRNGKVRRVIRVDDMQGKNWTTYNLPSPTQADPATARGLCVDRQGRIYVAFADKGRLLRIDNMSGANPVFLDESHLDKVHEFAPKAVAVL